MNVKVSACALGLVMSVGFATGWAHAAGPDDAIKARLVCMKAHGGVLKTAAPMLKGQKPFDAAALKSAYDAEDKACAGWDKMWGADTKQGVQITTDALPAIWTDAKGFNAAGSALVAAMPKLRAATDLASFKAAFPAFVGACKSCHEKFRR